MSERNPTLMDHYGRGVLAESDLEDAVVEAFGGLDALKFRNWYFDAYDSSVELLDAEDGFSPSAEQLGKLEEAGIHRVFVSFKGREPEKQNGTLYWMDGRLWRSGACFSRASRDDRRGKVQALQAALRTAEAKLRDIHRAWPTDPGYVNGTPDPDYPIRILESFRARCNEQWSTDTSGHEDWLCQVMNEANRERARILDRAIASLRPEARILGAEVRE